MQENNKEVDHLIPSQLFPNKKTAFTQNGDNTIFYNSANGHLVYAEINQTAHRYKINDIDLFPVNDLIQINDFNYFLPKKYSTFYKYPIGESGTAGGDFFTAVEFNELGLIKNITKNLPNSNHKYVYRYNKYAQLLKVFESNFLNNKILLENKYDESGRLISQEKNDKEVKSNREFVYGKDDRVLKEIVKEKIIASNGKISSDLKYELIYEYNKLGQISKKYTQDSNSVELFQYDPNGRIVNFVKYSGEKDKDDPKKLINHFVRKTYKYEGELVTEDQKIEYSIVNASVLVEKKWIPINLEEQQKLAWKKFNDNSESPLSEIEKKYSYNSNEINVVENKYNFSNRIRNNKAELSKEIVNSEKIKYILDNSGKIIRKESIGKNITIEEYSY